MFVPSIALLKSYGVLIGNPAAASRLTTFVNQVCQGSCVSTLSPRPRPDKRDCVVSIWSLFSGKKTPLFVVT